MISNSVFCTREKIWSFFPVSIDDYMAQRYILQEGEEIGLELENIMENTTRIIL